MVLRDFSIAITPANPQPISIRKLLHNNRLFGFCIKL